MHVSVVGCILKAKAIGTERLFPSFRHLRAALVQIFLSEGIEQGQRRLTHLAAPGEGFVETGKVMRAAAHFRSVEDLFPVSERIRPS